MPIIASRRIIDDKTEQAVLFKKKENMILKALLLMSKELILRSFLKK